MSQACEKRHQRELSFTVNGKLETVRIHPMERLLDVLRQQLGLTGTKEGCGEGECGACAILMDGQLVNSCLIPALQAADAQVITIEGVADDPEASALQAAFLQCGGAQCGMCTPGMILSASHLLRKQPAPTLEDIREALGGNLCRCTGYMQIFEAVAQAARPRTGR
ncbi:MAG: (2Fe-2S)-binding protein [Terriglobales bacterium]|jgi:carbon-monoxide dehydrogenase small subunit